MKQKFDFSVNTKAQASFYKHRKQSERVYLGSIDLERAYIWDCDKNII